MYEENWHVAYFSNISNFKCKFVQGFFLAISLLSCFDITRSLFFMHVFVVAVVLASVVIIVIVVAYLTNCVEFGRYATLSTIASILKVQNTIQ